MIASIGRPELLPTLKSLLTFTGSHNILVSLYLANPEITVKLDELNIPYVIHHNPGASSGRNVGIEVSLKSSQGIDGYIFINDRSRLTLSSLEAAQNFLDSNPNSVGVGKWKNELGATILAPRSTYSSGVDFLTCAESVLIVPIYLFHRGLMFDPDFGTGALTKWQSAEGAKLLLDASILGAQVLPVPEFVVTTQGSSKSLSLLSSLKKGFNYGLGSGKYFQISSGFISRNTKGVFFSVAPLVWFAFGKAYWRDAGFVFSLASCIGRLMGLYSPKDA